MHFFQAINTFYFLYAKLEKLGILNCRLAVITNILSTNFTTIYISKSIQSITSCWRIRIVGLSIIKYFNNGQNWGDGGIQEVIQDIYKLNKREKYLNKFIHEAINKIRLNEDNDSQHRLPIYSQKE